MDSEDTVTQRPRETVRLMGGWFFQLKREKV